MKLAIQVINTVITYDGTLFTVVPSISSGIYSVSLVQNSDGFVILSASDGNISWGIDISSLPSSTKGTLTVIDLP